MFTLGVAERAKNSRENSLRVNSRRNRLAAAPVKSVFKVGQGKKKLAGRPGNRKPCQRAQCDPRRAEKFHRRAARGPRCRDEGARKRKTGRNTWENGVQES